jgi:hypothetical protein
MLCRSLFVHLPFFCWSLYGLSFINLRLLVTPLVSSKFSIPICLIFEESEKFEDTKGEMRNEDEGYSRHASCALTLIYTCYTSIFCIWCLHLAIDSLCKGQ